MIVTKGEHYSWKAFFKLIRNTQPRKSLLVFGLILSTITTLAGLAVPLLTKNLIDGFSMASISVGLIALIIGAFIFQALISSIGSFMLGYVGEEIVAKLRKQVWNKLITLKVQYYENTKTGETVSRLINDTTTVKMLVADQFPSFITSIISMVGALIILTIMDWRMMLMIFISVPIVMLVLMPVGRMMHKIAKKLQKETADFTGITSQTLSEIRLVKASNGETVEKEHGEDGIKKLFNIGVSEAKVQSVIGPIMILVMMSIFVGILTYGALRVADGSLSNGTLIAFLLYLVQIIAPAAQFAQFFSQLQKTKGSTERLSEILAMEAEDFTVGEAVDVTGKEIKVEDVSFAYDEAHPILKNISFVAKPNTVVAFAGPSGGGKSTIFSLLERFYEPQAGEMSIGNHNLKEVSLYSWRSQIGYVAQESAILSGTIRDNLGYGINKAFSDEELWHVLELAYARQFVSEMPHGLDTEVGERGVKLSGGQRQRLAIARAFLRDPKILMLDEATASLDSESEEMVQKALTNLMNGRTTLIIAHRLSTIVHADKILFIEHGEVTGEGTHQELVETHELYHRYVKEQFKQ
ncbi:multidrug ABC transporter permease [Carnobacterium divergens]|uniref:Multidrug resistance ABC transporter ATP-binding and permease protein n=2 Tax=Carnobacterium divergens TaxID=2748 RepID=A0AAW8R6Y9_CARDV|nr:ABC transporter ATP-binding protein [Carnobacterium divergens]MDT1958148.1 ABC transporter ATP-binding protein/permease [Carnobacterium divergens]MDT1973415.1 ABC transporter ATP-binding protein/permease [Carnobacterium divergens]TFI68548.1 multidrug ABC transporter permease [Carnobacterium divergens]TFI68746.1 multidrug ABC transporter permease [Carnobacterium divergens]TFI83738.1 multidrug ABC transporter permease [Carnobacterium divergens]